MSHVVAGRVMGSRSFWGFRMSGSCQGRLGRLGRREKPSVRLYDQGMKRKASRCKVPKPLAPPPMKSRRKARHVTTLFHKLIKQKHDAIQENNAQRVDELDLKIRDMGGFEEYQRASQLNTRLHSTSKWVLKTLGERGLLNGVDDSQDRDLIINQVQSIHQKRPLRLLEIGAINTELLETAQNFHQKRKTCIHVQAIDLHSSHPDIQQVDFLKLPISIPGFDAIVCSMVLNYVSTPEDRGLMLRLIFQQLRPFGLCFLTLPKLCLDQSQYITKELFEDLLTQDIGFQIETTKETPKIYFWVLERPASESNLKPKTAETSTEAILNQRKAKKYRNSFAVKLH